MLTTAPSASLPFELFTVEPPPAVLHEQWVRAYEHASTPRTARHEDASTGYPQLTFAEGLYGFGSHHAFVLADVDLDRGLHALVAVDDELVQLLVMDASLCAPDYPLAEARAAAGLGEEEVAVALVVMRPANGDPMTVNMRAPVVIGLTSHRGVQVIIGSDLPLAKQI